MTDGVEVYGGLANPNEGLVNSNISYFERDVMRQE